MIRIFQVGIVLWAIASAAVLLWYFLPERVEPVSYVDGSTLVINRAVSATEGITVHYPDDSGESLRHVTVANELMSFGEEVSILNTNTRDTAIVGAIGSERVSVARLDIRPGDKLHVTIVRSAIDPDPPIPQDITAVKAVPERENAESEEDNQ